MPGSILVPGQQVLVATDLMVSEIKPGPATGPKRAVGKRLRRRGRVAFVFASVWLSSVVLLALIADLLPLKGYRQIGTVYRQPVGWRWPEFLGTDAVGRSELSRVIYGLRASLLLGLGAVAFSMVVALATGIVAGYLHGWFERVFDLFTDSILAFPPLLFLLAISAATTPGYRTLIISLSFIVFPTLGRVVRANTLVFANREFVLAARALGAPRRRIIVRELLPNVALPAFSVSFLAVAGIMVTEGSLSFLGAGIPPPTPSLGGMIAAGREQLTTSAHLVFVPGVVLLLTVYSLTVIGERTRVHFGLRRNVM
jgi:peptide/nickel transport system permease protein